MAAGLSAKALFYGLSCHFGQYVGGARLRVCQTWWEIGSLGESIFYVCGGRLYEG